MKDLSAKLLNVLRDAFLLSLLSREKASEIRRQTARALRNVGRETPNGNTSAVVKIEGEGGGLLEAGEGRAE